MTWHFLVLVALVSVISVGKETSVRAETFNRSELLQEISPKLAQAMSAEDYYNRGIDKYNSGDKQGAIADYNEAIRLNPDDADAYNNRGNAKSDLGDKQGAIADYNEAIRIKPDDDYAYYNRGNAKDDLGDRQGAITDYNEAIRLKPDFANAYYNRGLIKKQKQEALADFRKAAELYQQQGNTKWYNKSRDRIRELGG
ncbi:tetratricopeptide repeat protein [Cronbergia sp. UHCC 0137]|uniref:tetratricopeptide repeat protein n=1 Tax=Cronbergia sp. UHCC 0137 TaxID=3110239 RepID=UPI002B1F6075|nr:tetratricopeptide repeat protein [Cronbergia sp. UHCC 0137]MEA5619449.1 tetratricopeptide repeat protein [Cronbergia sp. UHCC 0137]